MKLRSAMIEKKKKKVFCSYTDCFSETPQTGSECVTTTDRNFGSRLRKPSMFYCSSGGSDPLDVSKSELLRGIITEKLSTAAREIIAVVGRTVADYEKEASGLRQQIARQKRQLERLHPQVTTFGRGLQSHEEVDDVEEQEVTGMEAAESPSLPGNQSEEEDPATIFELVEEEEEDPDYPSSSRSAQSGKKRRRSSLNIDSKKPLNLRIRILEDSETEVLSNNVFKKCPIWDLQCPHGLEEAAFLDLLRSTFPQLSAGKPFDTLITDRGRKLQPLRVKTLTPEEIYRAIKSIGNSALYIRLKEKEVITPEEEEHLVSDSLPADPVMVEKDQPVAQKSIGQSAPGGKGNIFSSATSQQQDFQTEEEGAESSVDFSGDEDRGSEGNEDSDPDYKPHKQTRKEKASCDKSGIQTVERTKGESEDNTECRSDNDPALEKDDNLNLDPDLQTSLKIRNKGCWKRSDGVEKSCKVCGVTYRQLGGLFKHIWSHSSNPQNVCGACGEKFESEEKLKEHFQSYKKPYNCPHCGKSFFSKDGLKQHITKHTGDNLFKCNVCNKTFSQKGLLNQHQWVHVENKPHKCDLCPQSFGLESHLRAHRKRHASKDVYKCKICSKSLGDRRSLAQHTLTHSDERPYCCQTCGKRFKSNVGLKVHKMTHTVRDRPFLCHVCCKTFPTKQTLKCHIRTHSSEKLFVCTVCGKGFTFSGNLKIHMRVHTGETPYKCNECGRRFKSKTHLTQHMKTHSGIKDFICGICGKGSSKPEHLKIHMRTHTGERPYKCSLCDKDFTQSHCLKTHMKTHQTEESPSLPPGSEDGSKSLK
ncbi:zinc finger protein 37-like [Cyprinodon tularosa]|uniref:zinc finger protein 37-like n=1 Tax=Cyprinodon tularosa TaxID=77115 RepID=UPI0018E275A9|nr:zinc finger protein 37-like [Cyprinodon tularosa]